MVMMGRNINAWVAVYRAAMGMLAGNRGGAFRCVAVTPDAWAGKTLQSRPSPHESRRSVGGPVPKGISRARFAEHYH